MRLGDDWQIRDECHNEIIRKKTKKKKEMNNNNNGQNEWAGECSCRLTSNSFLNEKCNVHKFCDRQMPNIAHRNIRFSFNLAIHCDDSEDNVAVGCRLR